ncbi:MAG: type II toxin-antitoxin system RelE/ParE family toxin [Cryomorphaceae bacterium]|nr:type II toxin-antitoxin system RelE/ParE family toxin [Flavobacteriales bacterium]
MASKKIRWTEQALRDKFEILEYWIERNKSKSYSEKLDRLIEEAIEQITEFPDQGKKTGFRDVRIRLVRSYLIYYLIDKDALVVIRIWDSRRDPEKLTLR